MKAIQRYAASLVAATLVLAVYVVARPAKFPEAEAQRLAGRFSFRKLPLPEVPGCTMLRLS